MLSNNIHEYFRYIENIIQGRVDDCLEDQDELLILYYRYKDLLNDEEFINKIVMEDICPHHFVRDRIDGGNIDCVDCVECWQLCLKELED